MTLFKESRKTAQEGNLVKFPVKAIGVDEGASTTVIFRPGQDLQPLSSYASLSSFCKEALRANPARRCLLQ